jgi:hypothetical protein
MTTQEQALAHFLLEVLYRDGINKQVIIDLVAEGLRINSRDRTMFCGVVYEVLRPEYVKPEDNVVSQDDEWAIIIVKE